jgi:hypothetical protein
VAKVDVQEGQLVPAGTALVELVPRGQIEIRLGVESADALVLHPGQAVQLFPTTVDDDEPIEGTLRLVTRRVNSEVDWSIVSLLLQRPMRCCWTAQCGENCPSRRFPGWSFPMMRCCPMTRGFFNLHGGRQSRGQNTR